MQAVQENLVRKQIMLSNENIKKIERIAKEKNSSIANVVRFAIDSFNPNTPADDSEDSELMKLVSARLKETILETEEMGKRLEKTLTDIDARNI